MSFELQGPDGSGAPRLVCYRCHKPAVTCICARVIQVQNRTRIVVIQHPRERLHPIGTARFLRLGLANSELHVAWQLGQARHRPIELPEGAALLYPGRGARQLDELPIGERPRALVVLDGTWHHARTLHRDLGELRGLPQVALSPAEPSRYRIRREPRAECLSTLEAIVMALKSVEPETQGLEHLLSAFDWMIDRQLEYIERRPGDKRLKRRRARESRAIPRALLEDYARLVLVYGESSTPDRGRRQLLQWTALRPATGELFDALAVPEAPLGERHLAHMQLTAKDFGSACDLGSLRQSFARFCPPQPIVAAWNQSSLALAGGLGLVAAGTLLLKSVYAAVFKQRTGTLEEVCERHALGVTALPLRGRAARRLAQAESVAAALRARAAESRVVT